jgi:serine protease AprX
LQQNPHLSPDSIKARLMKTATKNFPNITTVYDPSTRRTFVIQNDIFTVGAGYLDIWAALNDSTTVPTGTTATSPSMAFDSNSGEFHLAFGQTAIWGRNETFGETAIWGRNIIDGSNAIWGRGAIWGSTAIWGRSGTEGFTAIWGRSYVDGNTAIWGRNETEGSTAIWGRDSTEGSTAIWGRNASDQMEALSLILIRGE